MKLNPLSWASDIAEKLGVPVWVVWVVLIVAGYLLLYWFAGGAMGAETKDPYITKANKAVAEKRPLLVYVHRPDCAICREWESAIANLDLRSIPLARVDHSTHRQRAMKLMWGSQAASLKAMQQTTVPQLILYLPCKDGRWLKYRCVPAPT
jgi:hypothetical protein